MYRPRPKYQQQHYITLVILHLSVLITCRQGVFLLRIFIYLKRSRLLYCAIEVIWAFC